MRNLIPKTRRGFMTALATLLIAVGGGSTALVALASTNGTATDAVLKVVQGQEICGFAEWANDTGSSVTLNDAVITARDPDHPDGTPYYDFTPRAGSRTVANGQTLKVYGCYDLGATDPTGTWDKWLAWKDSSNVWHDGPKTQFQVVPAGSTEVVGTPATTDPPTAPTKVASSDVGQTFTNSQEVEINKPTNTAENDVVWYHVTSSSYCLDGTHANTDFKSANGWTVQKMSDTSTDHCSYIMLKKAGASEPTSYTFRTVTGAPSALVVNGGAIRGTDADNPWNEIGTNIQFSNVTYNFMGGTALQDNSMVLSGASTDPINSTTVGTTDGDVANNSYSRISGTSALQWGRQDVVDAAGFVGRSFELNDASPISAFIVIFNGGGSTTPIPTPTGTATPSPTATATPNPTNTYYVSTGGSDTNNGTSSSTPWKTLQKASDASVSSGGTILLNRGDTWTGEAALVIAESGINVDAYGTGNLPKITNATGTAGGCLRVTGSNNRISNLRLDTCGNQFEQSGARVYGDSNYFTGLYVTGNQAGIRIADGASGNQFISNSLIDNNKMTVNNAGGDNDYGAYNFANEGGDNTEIAWNTITGGIASSQDYTVDGSCLEIYRGSAWFHHNFCQDSPAGVEQSGVGRTNGSAGTLQNLTLSGVTSRSIAAGAVIEYNVFAYPTKTLCINAISLGKCDTGVLLQPGSKFAGANLHSEVRYNTLALKGGWNGDAASNLIFRRNIWNAAPVGSITSDNNLLMSRTYLDENSDFRPDAGSAAYGGDSTIDYGAHVAQGRP